MDRVVGVLDVVARAGGGLTLSEISREAQLPLSTARDLTGGLTERGWLVRRGRSYEVGSAPFVLDLIAHETAPWPDIDVDAYAERFELTTAVAVLVGHHVVYTARSRRVGLGDLSPIVDRHLPRRPLTTAAGRLLLALAPEATREGALRAMSSTDPDAVRSYRRLVPTLRRTRTAWSDGLADPRVAAVAVPSRQSDALALVFFGDRVTDRHRLGSTVATLQGEADGP